MDFEEVDLCIVEACLKETVQHQKNFYTSLYPFLEDNSPDQEDIDMGIDQQQRLVEYSVWEKAVLDHFEKKWNYVVPLKCPP